MDVGEDKSLSKVTQFEDINLIADEIVLWLYQHRGDASVGGLINDLDPRRCGHLMVPLLRLQDADLLQIADPKPDGSFNAVLLPKGRELGHRIANARGITSVPAFKPQYFDTDHTRRHWNPDNREVVRPQSLMELVRNTPVTLRPVRVKGTQSLTNAAMIEQITFWLSRQADGSAPTPRWGHPVPPDGQRYYRALFEAERFGIYYVTGRAGQTKLTLTPSGYEIAGDLAVRGLK